MAIQKYKSKAFDTKKEASEWAKEEKKKAAGAGPIKWETNRTAQGSAYPWEAVLYREI